MPSISVCTTGANYRMADNMDELKEVTFASGFGRITVRQIWIDG